VKNLLVYEKTCYCEMQKLSIPFSAKLRIKSNYEHECCCSLTSYLSGFIYLFFNFQVHPQFALKSSNVLKIPWRKTKGYDNTALIYTHMEVLVHSRFTGLWHPCTFILIHKWLWSFSEVLLRRWNFLALRYWNFSLTSTNKGHTSEVKEQRHASSVTAWHFACTFSLFFA